MRRQTPSLREASEVDPVDRLVLEFEDAWLRDGPPPLDHFRARLTEGSADYGLAALVKADLRNRFRRGERPTAREYLDRFSTLAGDDGRALSLIYDEYCLRVEADGPLDASAFCDLYPTWRDSIASQLVYHRQLSRTPEPASSTPDFPDEGDDFGDYRLVEALGQGGAARVFRARASRMGGKEFAVKVTLDRGSEPSILGRLDHPHIVPIVSTLVDPMTGLRGLCMPYRKGLPLDRVVRRLHADGPPRSARSLRLVVAPAGADDEPNSLGWSTFPERGTFAEGVAWLGMKLARALAHAHDLGIFHRDVKPENILLTARDGPQLLDFNLAHDPVAAEEAHAANRGGTLPYMASEHLRAFIDPAAWANVGPGADLFSLGLILRELLTGQAPWRPSENLPLPRAIKALADRRAFPYVPIRRINPAVPHALDAIVERCLSESAAGRYPNAKALADDLERFLERRPLRGASNRSVRERIANACCRHRRPLAGVALTLAIAAASAMFRPDGATRETLAAAEQIAALDAAGARGDAVDAARTLLKQRGDAVPALRRASGRHPRSVTLRVALGEALFREWKDDEAGRVFREARTIDPISVPALVGLVNVEIRAGRPHEAVALVDEVTRLAERSPVRLVDSTLTELREQRVKALIVAGEAALEAGQYARSMAFEDRAIEVLLREQANGLANGDLLRRCSYEASARSGRIGAAVKLGRLDGVRADYLEAMRWIERGRSLNLPLGYVLDRIERDLRRRLPASELAIR